MTKQRIRVGILFGGRSCEHEVSLRSAQSVIDAIDRSKYDIVPIGITKQGEWLRLPQPALPQERALATGDGAPVALLPRPDGSTLQSLTGANADAGTDAGAIDVIFPLIHGTFGEDGTLQGLLELSGIPYVGSGVLGSAVAMDKAVMKALCEQAGLPVAPYRTVLRKHWQDAPERVQRDCESLGYPLFVKPANLGSSVGISKAHNSTEFVSAMQIAAQYDRKIVVEQGIEDAHEVEVSVLGNDTPRASVPGEIIPCNEFYDYAAKYLAQDSQLIIPAPLPEPVVAQLQRYAIQAFQALDCAGMARVDFLVRRADHRIVLLEANTLPGFTSISMYPKLWAASGLSYPDLIDRLITLALERAEERQQSLTDYLQASDTPLLPNR
ncbi:MAG: D-alanine--D-alanine ligase family protein [Gammaproteobacteria bacterium]